MWPSQAALWWEGVSQLEGRSPPSEQGRAGPTPTAVVSLQNLGREGHTRQPDTLCDPGYRSRGLVGREPPPSPALHCWVSHFLSCSDPLHPGASLAAEERQSLLSSPCPHPHSTPLHFLPGEPWVLLLAGCGLCGPEVPLHGTFPF